MIWREHKIILLHIPRSGGTTIEGFLSKAAGHPSRRAAEISEGFWNKHIDAARAEIVWDRWFHDPEYTVMTVVRNPLELVASQYLQTIVADEDLFRTIDEPDTQDQLIRRFREWIDSSPRVLLPTSAEVDNYMSDLPGVPNTSAGASTGRFLQTKRPREIKLLRFENYEEEVDKLKQRLHITAPAETHGVRSRYGAAAASELYRRMYDSKCIRIVKSRLAGDFRAYGYNEFEPIKDAQTLTLTTTTKETPGEAGSSYAASGGSSGS